MNALERCKSYGQCNDNSCPYYREVACLEELRQDALAVLKEHDNCENCAIAIEDRQPVVRCKDCKHRPKEPNWKTHVSGYDLEFPKDSKCPCRCSDEYYSWYPKDDWFCANGEKRTNND